MLSGTKKVDFFSVFELLINNKEIFEKNKIIIFAEIMIIRLKINL